jgi:hypothetical protein
MASVEPARADALVAIVWGGRPVTRLEEVATVSAFGVSGCAALLAPGGHHSYHRRGKGFVVSATTMHVVDAADARR